jgi:DnaK suppressor protein
MATILKRDDLEHFSQRLREREAQLLAELRAGEQRAGAESFRDVAGEAPDRGDASFADTVSDGVNAERERDSGELRDVQDALSRIEAGTYGLCLSCGEPIDRERLDAAPTARYDIEHQREQERVQPPVQTPTL